MKFSIGSEKIISLNSSHDDHAGLIIIFLRQEQMLYFQENKNFY